MTFSSEEWSKYKLQTVWIWNPGKFPSFCTGLLKMCNFAWISSAILAHCAVFRTFLDFTKMWTCWNFESIFLTIVHQKGLFDAIKENPNFLTCRRVLHIYWQWLLIVFMFTSKFSVIFRLGIFRKGFPFLGETKLVCIDTILNVKYWPAKTP